jgi:Origin recognition complex (ORC) subunit 5 C-terminus
MLTLLSSPFYSTQILKTNENSRLIMGEGYANPNAFVKKVYQCFLETLVQSLHNLTSDVREYLRLGRALWPRYIAPLRADAIATTLASIRKEGQEILSNQQRQQQKQREILTILDQRIFPHIRQALELGFGLLAYDSPGIVETQTKPPQSSILDTVPVFAKYFMLAAFVCQTNRPDKDKQLFSIEKNGRKRKNTTEDTGEDVAFGTGQDFVKNLRPRAFPAERLYSLYVSMIGLNASDVLTPDAKTDQDEMMRSLGNIHFHETVAYLKDIGVLHDHPLTSSMELIRLSQRSFWSSITRDEADAIAKSVDIPLERYTLER